LSKDVTIVLRHDQEKCHILNVDYKAMSS